MRVHKVSATAGAALWLVASCAGGSVEGPVGPSAGVTSNSEVESSGGNAGRAGASGAQPGGEAGRSSAAGAGGTGGAGRGAAGRAGGSPAAGSGGRGAAGMRGAGSGGASGSAAVTRVCKNTNATCKTTLSDAAPALKVGTWVDISPPEVPFGGGTTTTFTQGIAVDPCDPSILYLTVSGFDPGASKAGLYKSADAGSSWNRVGRIMSSSSRASHLEEPIRVRVDPEDSQHLYAVDGVRGGTMGFWVSCDGGETFFQPEGFAKVQQEQDLSGYDTYDIAADPVDFNHILVAFHGAWGWTGTRWNTASGVLESKDGGETWIAHPPASSNWGTGHSIVFLSNPSLGIGDGNTWLLSTQSNERWRTSDAGVTWKRVSANGGITHGGGTIYYDSKGALYASGTPTNQRSMDNGVTWTGVADNAGATTAILGDGTTLYSAPTNGPTSMYRSPESDGKTWAEMNSQKFAQGPFELVYDAHNSILYSGSWQAGMWALKVK